MLEEINIKRRDGIAHVVLNRPSVRNAVTLAMWPLDCLRASVAICQLAGFPMRIAVAMVLGSEMGWPSTIGAAPADLMYCMHQRGCIRARGSALETMKQHDERNRFVSRAVVLCSRPVDIDKVTVRRIPSLSLINYSRPKGEQGCIYCLCMAAGQPRRRLIGWN